MTSPSAPLVSVVMAVRDGETYLAQAIGSVLGQRLGDLELVVVDDGSADRSAAIASETGDARVRLVSNATTLGLAASLNRGIAAARGTFVARLDADDVATPERLARQVAFLDAHPEIALAGSWYTDIDASGTEGKHHRLPTDHWDLRWHLCLHSPFVHSAVIWRRELVAERVGGYDERLAFSEDYDLWRRIAAVARVANVPESLVWVRQHARSMTTALGGAASAGLRMRAADAARVLGWGDDAGGNERRLERLYRLAASVPRSSRRELLRDARELMRLHAAFVAREGVPADVARRQRRAVLERVARGVLRLPLDGEAEVVER